MWAASSISVEVSDVEGDVVLVAIETPVGRVDLIGRIEIRGTTLLVEAAHVQGLSPGALGRAGLNAIARRLMEEAGVDGLIVEGSTRTTGRARGRTQRPFRYPRSHASADDG